MTRAENYVTLEFLSRSSNEGFARVAAAGFAAMWALKPAGQQPRRQDTGA